MARPAHFYEPGFPYLITSVTDHRQPLLTQNSNGRRVLNDLDFYRNQFRYQLLGYVIMPDHFHTVILPSEDDFKRFAAELLEQERAGKVYHGYDQAPGAVLPEQDHARAIAPQFLRDQRRSRYAWARRLARRI